MSSIKPFIEQAKSHPTIPVAVINAEESHVLEGMMEARDMGLIEPILIGKSTTIESLCSKAGFELDDTVVINVDSETEAIQVGIDLVKKGKALALAKGWIHTDALMHPVLSELRTAQRISHIFVAELSSYPKLLFITDAAINIAPTLSVKAEIVQNAVDLARLLGVKLPKVAALSAVEVVKPDIISSVDAACLSKMAERGQIEHAIVDGPLAFDNAISVEAAEIKHIKSTVAGDVDILLAPDLNAANILAKDLEYLASATLAGIVVGAKVPILLPSRSDPPQARLIAAAIAVLMHYGKQKGDK